MPRHLKTPRRAVDVARSRHPAVLGGVIGGAVALALGVGAVAFVAGEQAGVHFTFGPEAASVSEVSSRGPEVTHDGASASKATGAQSSVHSTAVATSSPAAASSPVGAPVAPSPTASDAKSTASTAASSSGTSKAAAPRSSASPAATSSASPSATAAASQPSATPEPSTSPTPAPTGGCDVNLLGVVCISQ